MLEQLDLVDGRLLSPLEFLTEQKISLCKSRLEEVGLHWGTQILRKPMSVSRLCSNPKWNPFAEQKSRPVRVQNDGKFSSATQWTSWGVSWIVLYFSHPISKLLTEMSLRLHAEIFRPKRGSILACFFFCCCFLCCSFVIQTGWDLLFPWHRQHNIARGEFLLDFLHRAPTIAG